MPPQPQQRQLARRTTALFASIWAGSREGLAVLGGSAGSAHSAGVRGAGGGREGPGGGRDSAPPDGTFEVSAALAPLRAVLALPLGPAPGAVAGPAPGAKCRARSSAPEAHSGPVSTRRDFSHFHTPLDRRQTAASAAPPAASSSLKAPRCCGTPERAERRPRLRGRSGRRIPDPPAAEIPGGSAAPAGPGGPRGPPGCPRGAPQESRRGDGREPRAIPAPRAECRRSVPVPWRAARTARTAPLGARPAAELRAASQGKPFGSRCRPRGSCPNRPAVPRGDPVR